MLELIGVDGLTQWDVGRQVKVDKDVDMVHFSNRPYGNSKNVKVTDGVADVPDMFLTSCAPLRVWAYVGDFEKGYTKIEKIYEVKPKNRPEDYIYTPEDVKTWEKLQSEIGDISDLETEAKKNLVSAINEAAQSGGSDISLGLTSASVGQIIKVKAVDESGKPTAWEAADMPSGGGGGSGVGLYKFVQTVTIPDGENVSIVDITIPAKTRKLYILGKTNTGITFGTTVRTYIKNGNVVLAGLYVDRNMSHRNALFSAELYDDIQFMSFSSSNATFYVDYPGYATFNDYTSYFAKENNSFRIMIMSEKSTNQYFAAGSTFNLYAACEE